MTLSVTETAGRVLQERVWNVPRGRVNEGGAEEVMAIRELVGDVRAIPDRAAWKDK